MLGRCRCLLEKLPWRSSRVNALCIVSRARREAERGALAPAVERVGGREHGVDGDVGGIRRVFSRAFQAGELVLFIHWRVAAERRGGAGDFFFT